MYYLTLDVIETECHVLSKKNWKDCAHRILHNTVYGQCKAIFYLDLPERILYLHTYNCTVRPVSRRSIVRMCPDCPGPVSINTSDPSISETVRESLEKINREVAVGKKLYLFQVTKAYSQWVFGPSYFLEYLVTEVPCPKALPGLEKCLEPPADFKPIGLCKGSLAKNGPIKYVDGSCEFFQIKPTEAPGSQPSQQQIPQQVASHSTAAPVQGEPKGSVQVLPELDEDNAEEEAQNKKPAPAFRVNLDLTTDLLKIEIHRPLPLRLFRNPPKVIHFPGGPK
ncbi:fetuin-B-like [Macrotis lagotis]|uniref:fetuin-B-like n=1 Tax=Macrotis lagotis TaxID=92651 RepID=UPI003D688BB1